MNRIFQACLALLVLGLLPTPPLKAQAPLAGKQKRSLTLAPQSAEQRALLSEIGDGVRQLTKDVERGDLRALRREIRAGLDPSLSDSSNMLFQTAVCHGQPEAVRLVAQASSKPDILFTLSGVWRCVAEQDNPQLALAVLEARTPHGWDAETAREAIREGSTDLLAMNADRAFRKALENGQQRLAEKLLHLPSTGPDSLRHALYWAAGRSVEQVRILLVIGEPWITGKVLDYALVEAVKSSRTEGSPSIDVMRLLFRVGASITKEAVAEAAKSDHPEVMRELISAGLATQSAIAFALHYEAPKTLDALAQDVAAAATGRPDAPLDKKDAARWLLIGGADPERPPQRVNLGAFDLEVRDEQGRTGLFRAVQRQKSALVQVYIDAGANVDAEDKDGWTPLHAAARLRNAALMAALRRAGATDTKVQRDTPASLYWPVMSLTPRTGSHRVEGKPLFFVPKWFHCKGSPVRLDCSQGDFRISLRAEPTYVRWVTSWGGPPLEEKGPEATGDSVSYTVTGLRGYDEITVSAVGPADNAPEVREVALLAWNRTHPRRLHPGFIKLAFGVLYLIVVVGFMIRARSRKERRAAEKNGKVVVRS